ncbi:MAG: crossover junction endodeoxyribonuclease RuvC [Candidatus Thermofonsia Clade 1 bacterium]|uniref:Crossover junction endodeoxyribonuclease RuvC n=1 Tax=Candidatus Thermofonsia Clade 1 bacterium TaxID=2364210 RepID=A0A2M8PEU7_9CHLR|nr:MAG: crossover junction endodeoxyribonuclease RuvC [Candidatus Thermofonsia Clade 1 bacterium]RMF51164.1 MAG: crossover junction endodeoxyribonuclease RuvC [Chloroflexota bacterium]
MLIMGIDPGTATTGYAFVCEDATGTLQALAYGAILTPPDQPMPHRLKQIYAEVRRLIAEYQPTEAAVEEMFFGRNITAAITVAQGRGVVLLALADAGVRIREYKPAQVKQTVSGSGNAGKKQVQAMVKTLLNLEQMPKPDDAADALAIAITALQSSRWERLVED